MIGITPKENHMEPIILEIKAFFFNAQTDYLPYYRQFSFELTEEMKGKDLLALIKEQNEDFSYPEEELVFKINDLVVDGNQSMSEVVERLGTSLQIDPVNSYRSTNGLIIDDTDFMKSYELLAPFASEEDLEYYKSLYALHYASETEKFDHDYIGDAVLILADKMISEGSEHKEEILEAITSPYSGLFDCEYENNFFNAQDHTTAIEALKMMAKSSKKSSFADNLASRLAEKKDTLLKKEKKDLTAAEIEGKQIAYYAGAVTGKADSMYDRIIQANSKVILFSRSNKLSGLSLLGDNKTLAYTKAGTTLLDALDSGAQILIVEEKEVYDMFKKHFNDLEKTIGRDIDLELILAEDFIELTHRPEEISA
jgi:succinate dehydrogenase/fumarate reductase-like Fe-S protein